MLNIYDTRSKSLFNTFAGIPALQSSLCKDGVNGAHVGCGVHALKCLHHTVNSYITYYTFLQGHKPPWISGSVSKMHGIFLITA